MAVQINVLVIGRRIDGRQRNDGRLNDDAGVRHVQLRIVPVDPTGAMDEILIGFKQQIKEIDHRHILVQNTLE